MKIHEFAHHEGNYYLITEFCEGGELLTKINKIKRFSEAVIANLMKQLLSAISYCHERNIVHR